MIKKYTNFIGTLSLCKPWFLMGAILYAVPMVLSSDEMQRVQKDLMSADKFGPTTARIINITMCKAPKRRNCTEIDIEVSEQLGYKNTTFYVKFLRPTSLTKTKISVWRLKTDSLTIPSISRVVEKPCNHFIIGPLLKKYMNVNGVRCTVAKGQFTVHVNCDQMVNEMMGFQFFYGIYRVETQIYSDDCIASCTLGEFSLEPKFKKTKNHHEH